ncbi:ABC transporter permease [Chelatococcus asaccharovorans]|uniref:Peptide/nickel transport system permease protein n=1 Tax=Chelatococcus asaccharovorans TaxID=28210 RepID=A0A2V3UEP1_9HYPH|nr:ABC transporter permease [Chelatococcus asaccharovorans]MBS7707338.1 ABC transporter permease [Chelatococcus asaccharovorans]PXW63520.1 peptide/nickel transport system permease protein [Chelatococcus asaccharovorans]CAH1650858.1 Peptide/nickel transport system permease protein [Chelatococcus asaccharovorans]CAH1692590.1 Peptide/nickel transport system permease protein [Chelatococcus asaccharovorans]
MSTNDIPLVAEAEAKVPPAVTRGSRMGKASRQTRGMLVSDVVLIATLLAVVAMVLVPGWIAPYSPTEFNPAVAMMPPSWEYPFGTDEFGRDILSRVIHGARPTLVVAIAGAIMGVGLGTVTGLLAGYAGGRTDEVLMRFMDALMSFPTLILATLIVVMLGSNPVNVIAAIGIVFWPRSARIARAVAQDVAQRSFIEAAWVRGESHAYILFRELLPGVLNVVVVDLSLRITYGTMLSASLSYLGIGVTPPTPAWGLMVKDGQQFIQFASWMVIWPCVAISVVAVAAVLAGERLRQILAPTERGN